MCSNVADGYVICAYVQYPAGGYAQKSMEGYGLFVGKFKDRNPS